MLHSPWSKSGNGSEGLMNWDLNKDVAGKAWVQENPPSPPLPLVWESDKIIILEKLAYSWSPVKMLVIINHPVKNFWPHSTSH